MAERAAPWSGMDHATAAEPGSAEWPALYAQYLMRAAGQSARTTELYQKIMDCVARGELASTVVRDTLPAFVQTHGTAYATRLAEISTQFFSRMVQIDNTYSHELMELVMPGASTPPVPPPPFDAADPITWFQQLTDYAGQLSAAAVTAYQSLLNRVAAGEVAPDRLQAASSDYLERRLPEHLRRLSGLYFDLLNGLTDLRAGYEEAFLTSVLATTKKADQETPAALNLVAPLGGTTSASLLLTNTRDEPAFIRCTVTDLRRADGVGPAFAPQIIIAPETLELRRGEEASLVLSLRLDEDDYEPDVLYVGVVHIARRGEPRLDVPLRVTATPPAPAKPATPPAPAASPAAAPARKRKSTRPPK